MKSKRGLRKESEFGEGEKEEENSAESRKKVTETNEKVKVVQRFLVLYQEYRHSEIKKNKQCRMLMRTQTTNKKKQEKPAGTRRRGRGRSEGTKESVKGGLRARDRKE